jgi:hypothetical protein
MTKGVSPDRLTATFSGEDLSVSQLHDDERDRGVCVWLQVADAGKPRVIPHTPPPPDTLQAPPELVTPRLQLGFALGGGTILANALPSLSNANIEVRPNEVVSCTVINAAGREMFLSREDLFDFAKLLDPSKPEASQPRREKIVQDAQVVHVRGLSPGRHDIVIARPASKFGDIVGKVTVPFDAKVFFHFVDGPSGIKTSRTPATRQAL